MIFDGSQINLAIAFLAGLSTFFASCLLPLVPTYLAFLSGTLIQDGDFVDDNRNEPKDTLTTQAAPARRGKNRWRVLKFAGLFVGGFVSTFIFIGFVLNRFALLLGDYRGMLERLGGVFFIFMALIMLGMVKNQLVQREFRFQLPVRWKRFKHLFAWLTGIAFSFGWTPCIGPVLAVILYWSTQQATSTQGLFLLTSFGMGLGTPFLLVALAFEPLLPWLKKSQRLTQIIQATAGIIILLTGIFMLMGQFNALSIWLLNSFDLPHFTP